MSKRLEFIGTCITTVDDLNFWDATEMAQCIENSTPTNVLDLVDLLDDVKLAAKIKSDPENFDAGTCKSIVWIYDEDEDLHYFYYMHVNESRIKTFIQFNESLQNEIAENSVLLLYDNSTPKKIYAVYALAVSQNKSYAMAHINTKTNMYRIVDSPNGLRAAKVLIDLKKIGINGTSIGRNNNKTPLWELSCKYNNINKFVKENEDRLRQIKDVNFNV